MSYPYGGGDSDTSESSTFTTGVQPISTANPRQPIPANRLTPEQTDRILGQLTVTWESLPQLPFWAPLGGQTETWRRQSVAAAVNGLAVLLQRPLTATEANAVAEHSCKARVKESYEVPVLLGSAAFFTYRGREKWRFPFWTPKPTSTWFTPHSFPTISYAILRGAPAMRLWTGVRFLAYMAVLRFLTQPLFTGYANAGFAINVMTDKRLKAVTEMREREMQAQKAARSGLPSASTVPSTEEQQEQQQQQSTWPRPAQSQRGQPQQPLPSWRKPQPAKEETSSSAFDDNSGLFDDDDNDASPIAPSHRRPAPTPAPSTTAPGSAWSKLREQAKSGGTGATASSAPTASSAESYTYAESEREKNYARDQAQKEFDALLERERRSSS